MDAAQLLVIPGQNCCPEELDHMMHLATFAQKSIDEYVANLLYEDELEDILFECGICPIELFQQVEENLDQQGLGHDFSDYSRKHAH
ncbi:MAG: hypothetical protein AAGF26_02690 [Cyanobacteria bacterium P01_G01_bin.49]